MRKQSRKLWLGDWQRDQEPPIPQEPADTFVIMREGDGAERQRDVRSTVAVQGSDAGQPRRGLGGGGGPSQ